MLPASSLMPIIAARGLVRVYRLGGAPVPALRGVELTVGRGEFLAIMGRSGSGKSTLLNLLGCLDRPDAGRYWLDGVEVTALPPRQLPALRLHKLGFVFQQHNLLPTLTALENVALPLRYARCPGRERARRAQAALTAVGLADRVHHRPTELSGGQQQRVAIARALVNRPALLLADEPTGAVDSQTSTALIDLLRALKRQLGQPVVIVTHDETVAARTDRIIRIADGRIAGDERLN